MQPSQQRRSETQSPACCATDGVAIRSNVQRLGSSCELRQHMGCWLRLGSAGQSQCAKRVTSARDSCGSKTMCPEAGLRHRLLCSGRLGRAKTAPKCGTWLERPGQRRGMRMLSAHVAYMFGTGVALLFFCFPPFPPRCALRGRSVVLYMCWGTSIRRASASRRRLRPRNVGVKNTDSGRRPGMCCRFGSRRRAVRRARWKN